MDEKSEITALIVGFIIDGNTEADIREYVSSKYPNIDIEEEWEEAVGNLRDAHKRMTPHNRAFVIEGLREMYRRLVEIGDYAGAAKVLVDLNKATR